jgi:hypothetical protein
MGSFDCPPLWGPGSLAGLMATGIRVSRSARSVVDPRGRFRGPVRPLEFTGSGWAQDRHSGDGRAFGEKCGTRSGPSPKIKSLGGEDCCAERLFRRHPREVKGGRQLIHPENHEWIDTRRPPRWDVRRRGRRGKHDGCRQYRG